MLTDRRVIGFRTPVWWGVAFVFAVIATVLVPAPQRVDGQTVVALTAFPLEGPCRFYRNFGDYRSPTRTHEGEDIAPVADANDWRVEAGHDVYAALPGTVKQVWTDTGSTSGAGNGIQLTHAGGTYTRYYHLASFAPGVATVGATVAAGQVLGLAGDTGTSDGNYHLHFELHPGGGAAIDPMPSLEALGGCGATPTPTPAPAPPAPPPEPTPSAIAAMTTPITVPEGTAGFVAVTPGRRLDTRVDDLDGNGTPEPLTGSESARVDLTGVVPDTATAVALNITATGPAAAGYLTAHPCGPTPPTTSSLNYVAGQVVPGAVIVGIGEGRSVCVTTYAPTDLVVDLAGWFEPEAGTSLTGITPSRVYDTRTGGTPLSFGEVQSVDVTATGEVPIEATAVALNVTAVDPTASGWVTAWPCDDPQPVASNLNPAAGTDVANLVNVGTSGGLVCFASYQPTDLVVDVLGWYSTGDGGRLTPVEPTRVADTRSNVGGSRLNAGETLEIDLRTQALLPVDVVGLQATVTAVGPAAPGFLTAYPCGTRPNASNLNYTASSIVANSAQIGLSTEGLLCVYSLAASDVIIDVTGLWRTV